MYLTKDKKHNSPHSRVSCSAKYNNTPENLSLHSVHSRRRIFSLSVIPLSEIVLFYSVSRVRIPNSSVTPTYDATFLFPRSALVRGGLLIESDAYAEGRRRGTDASEESSYLYTRGRRSRIYGGKVGSTSRSFVPFQSSAPRWLRYRKRLRAFRAPTGSFVHVSMSV